MFTAFMGPSIKYVTLFLANFDPPSPLSHFVTYPGTPKSTSHISDPQIIGRPSTNARTKAPCTNFLWIDNGVFVRVFCLSWSFVRKVLSGVVLAIHSSS